ncbi:hypothetical protein FS749_011541 [Ceratobasidium sp. UAMH 11750]|nr:hypothetical protein FS749_011541 [Ceratobasidium sp. UAMH 11750]
MALLKPFARAVKCLESSASTPADVCLFWLASQATLNDIFIDSDKRADFMISEETIGDVRAIVNGRFSEMFDGSSRRMYISTLLLDPCYIGSTLFTRKNINPLATKVYLPASVPSSSSQSVAHDIPDQDLRDALPVYRVTGGYLGELLVHEINSGREELFQSYPSDAIIVEEFRLQFMNYVRQAPPFDRHMGALSALEYWTNLSRHPHAQILAYLAIKLFSVVPNSMAEERTVSCFTKLNSPDRARQKTSTLLFMTQIKQHEQRIENTRTGRISIAPTVRFRSLSDILQPTTSSDALREATRNALQAGSGPSQADAEVVPEDPTLSHDGGKVDPWDEEEGDGEAGGVTLGARSVFELADTNGINLREPCLRDLLSDTPVPGVGPKDTDGVNTASNGARTVASKPTKIVAHMFEF